MTASATLIRVLAAIEADEFAAKQSHGWWTGSRYEGQPQAWVHHVRRQDSARTLRRCVADRRIFERHSPTPDGRGRPSCSFCGDAGKVEWPCEDFKDLTDRYGLVGQLEVES